MVTLPARSQVALVCRRPRSAAAAAPAAAVVARRRVYPPWEGPNRRNRRGPAVHRPPPLVRRHRRLVARGLPSRPGRGARGPSSRRRPPTGAPIRPGGSTHRRTDPCTQSEEEEEEEVVVVVEEGWIVPWEAKDLEHRRPAGRIATHRRGRHQAPTVRLQAHPGPADRRRRPAPGWDRRRTSVAAALLAARSTGRHRRRPVPGRRGPLPGPVRHIGPRCVDPRPPCPDRWALDGEKCTISPTTVLSPPNLSSSRGKSSISWTFSQSKGGG